MKHEATTPPGRRPKHKTDKRAEALKANMARRKDQARAKTAEKDGDSDR